MKNKRYFRTHGGALIESWLEDIDGGPIMSGVIWVMAKMGHKLLPIESSARFKSKQLADDHRTVWAEILGLTEVEDEDL